MKERLIALISALSPLFGPSGREDEVRSFIIDTLSPLGLEYSVDRVGNLTYRLPSNKKEPPASAKKLMISAHMDEVGFMITNIDDRGMADFCTIGGIDAAVLCGRPITVLAKGMTPISAVISSVPTHMLSAADRKRVTPASKLYIDIGADCREEAEAIISIGDFATFDSSFCLMGEDGVKLMGKALDDRLGCAVMICLAETLCKSNRGYPFDVYLSFSTREEIGYSGSRVVANRLSPHIALVLESTAAADLPSVEEGSRVAIQGAGGALSFADRSTLYDRPLYEALLGLGKSSGIRVQPKRFVSGGNDSSHIQRSGHGVRTAALSAPSRYIHSPYSVVDSRDVMSMYELALALIEDRDGSIRLLTESEEGGESHE